MKVLYLVIVVQFAIISCSNGNGHSNDREIVPYPEKYVQDNYLLTADSLKPKFFPDTTVDVISLNSSKNVQAYFKIDVMSLLNDDDIPNASFISNDSKQMLKVFFHPGNTENCFSEFEVSSIFETNRNTPRISHSQFKTENGIKLGMSLGELRSIKGEPLTVEGGETAILKYTIDNFESSNFLKRYNVPRYYAEYSFENGYLVKYKFGFEYP